ncbi:SAM-dependent methyltransferase [Marinobacter sp. R17]|uniref:SAM-dependent methyltransferase n=1 Tax=Marinobacter TaxID=2742 RepID=UPI000F4C4AB0|nr:MULTISPECIES: SAM-dependent methyltransferase [Marinobacter]ROT99822.1 SAM-dependent methyltransferase [Marinobacter sp. R17]
MQLDQVVPWGRSFDEYRAMFALSPADLGRRILGCGDGPASFNATLSKQGGQVVSCDPVYQFTADDIRRRIDAVYPDILAKMTQEADRYLWSTIPDVAALGRTRQAAMADFLTDYAGPGALSRYVAASLPALPFADRRFELALCSHYLFLYSDHVDTAGHIAGLQELCRVANEVRVFPLVDLDGNLSRHLQPATEALMEAGLEVTREPVPYRFQKGATDMLVLKRT